MSKKSKRRSRKALLKKAFADILPAEARARPKRSFQAPGAAWLQGGLKEAYQQLTSGETYLTEILDPLQLSHYTKSWGKDTPGQVFAVSALLFIDLWTRQYLGDRHDMNVYAESNHGSSR